MKNYREDIQKVVEILSSIHGFNDFCIEYTQSGEKGNVIDEFIGWKSRGKCSPNERIVLNIAKEKMQAIRRFAQTNQLSGFLEHLKIEDPLLEEFCKDFSNCKTGQVAFKKADVQHYKTITEKIAYYGIDLLPVYEKYRNTQNPYINAQLAGVFNRSGMFEIGLFHLHKALNYALSLSNIYWETPFGVYGCTEALWELQYLLGRKGLEELSREEENISRNKRDFKFKILELLYLYLCRSIHIIDNTLQSANYLSNRANLLLDYGYDFHLIFANNGFCGAKMEVQFLSDKAYAYNIGASLGLALLFEQDFKDSLKMYQHGSLIPNATGGLHDEEDATMEELNKRGWLRSIELGNRLYEKYKEGEYRFNKYQINTLISYIRKKHPDKNEKFDWHKL